MRIEDVRPTSFVSELYCDRCGAKAKHDIAEGFNNFLQIEFDSSWGSAIGDGVHVEIDLCHSCVQEGHGYVARCRIGIGHPMVVLRANRMDCLRSSIVKRRIKAEASLGVTLSRIHWQSLSALPVTDVAR